MKVVKLLLASLFAAIGVMLSLMWGATCEAQGWGAIASGVGGIVIGLGLIVSWVALAAVGNDR